MKIVKILNEIYVKMQDNRFREDIPAEQVICLFRKELEELAEETHLNLHEALILSGIMITAFTQNSMNSYSDAISVAQNLGINNFEIFMLHNIFTSLQEKGFIIISEYDYNEQSQQDKNLMKAFRRRESLIPFFNKTLLLTESTLNRIAEA